MLEEFLVKIYGALFTSNNENGFIFKVVNSGMFFDKNVINVCVDTWKSPKHHF